MKESSSILKRTDSLAFRSRVCLSVCFVLFCFFNEKSCKLLYFNVYICSERLDYSY